MPNVELVTAADVRLMQGLAQRVTATDGTTTGIEPHMTVACLGAPRIPRCGLYYSVGFRELTRDAPGRATRGKGYAGEELRSVMNHGANVIVLMGE